MHAPGPTWGVAARAPRAAASSTVRNAARRVGGCRACASGLHPSGCSASHRYLRMQCHNRSINVCGAALQALCSAATLPPLQHSNVQHDKCAAEQEAARPHLLTPSTSNLSASSTRGSNSATFSEKGVGTTLRYTMGL